MKNRQILALVAGQLFAVGARDPSCAVQQAEEILDRAGLELEPPAPGPDLSRFEDLRRVPPGEPDPRD